MTATKNDEPWGCGGCDHQLISLKLAAVKHSYLTVLIPHAIVRTIIEGKTALSAAFILAAERIK